MKPSDDLAGLRRRVSELETSVSLLLRHHAVSSGPGAFSRLLDHADRTERRVTLLELAIDELLGAITGGPHAVLELKLRLMTVLSSRASDLEVEIQHLHAQALDHQVNGARQRLEAVNTLLKHLTIREELSSITAQKAGLLPKKPRDRG